MAQLFRIYLIDSRESRPPSKGVLRTFTLCVVVLPFSFARLMQMLKSSIVLRPHLSSLVKLFARIRTQAFQLISHSKCISNDALIRLRVS